MASYFYKNAGGELVGPLTGGQVKSLAKSGSISADTLMKRDDTEQVFRARQIKGLFDVEPDSRPVLTTAKIAEPSALVAVEAIAVAAPVQATAKSAISRFLNEDQDAASVEAAVASVQQILMSGEELLYVAVQQKPMVNVFPDCVVLTNRRFIVYRRKMLGRSDFTDHRWRDLKDAQLKEGTLGATLEFQTAGGKVSIDYLPKKQARVLYRHAQEMEEQAVEDQRTRRMEEDRARAGGVFVQSNGAAPAAAPAAPAVGTDPVARLQQLKSMLDAGLISAGEYDTKKLEILSRM